MGDGLSCSTSCSFSGSSSSESDSIPTPDSWRLKLGCGSVGLLSSCARKRWQLLMHLPACLPICLPLSIVSEVPYATAYAFACVCTLRAEALL